MRLENNALFNAGRGSVFTATGTEEMDAAVMDGRYRRVGAIAAIFGPKNLVLAARAVMERSQHLLLVGDGAVAFCREHGSPFADPDYFATPSPRRALEQILAQQMGLLREEHDDDNDDASRHGTVGTVARDRAGNLAAATSTGRMTGK